MSNIFFPKGIGYQRSAIGNQWSMGWFVSVPTENLIKHIFVIYVKISNNYAR